MKKRKSNTVNKLWLITGLLILALTTGLYYLKKQGPLPHKKLPAKPAPHLKAHKPPSPPLPPKQQFDFYNVLPQTSTAKPTPSLSPQTTTKSVNTSNKKIATSPKSAAIKKSSVKELYFLQIASVKNYSDADALKANLTLAGYNVVINKVNLGQKIYYRVILGPYDSLINAQTAQKNLKKENKNAILIKTK